MLELFDDFWRFSKTIGSGVFLNHPTEHSAVGELASGGSVAVAVDFSDM